LTLRQQNSWTLRGDVGFIYLYSAQPTPELINVSAGVSYVYN